MLSIATGSRSRPENYFGLRPDSVATQIYFSDRDRVGLRPWVETGSTQKNIFLKNREYMFKSHKELNRLKVSVIDTEIFDFMPNIRDNFPNI